jgi:hypothetical protein
MIILTEKKELQKQSHRINEAQEIPVLRFETFIQDIVSGIFKPNHIEIFSKQSTRFHVVFAGKFITNVKAHAVDFSSKGVASTIISIGKNDASRIHQSPDSNHPYFRIEMINGAIFFISET